MASSSSRGSVLTLPSNSSMDIYPGNTVADYRVQLPKTLVFNSPHEVALTALHYPVSWFNFPESETYSVTYRVFSKDLDRLRMNWSEDVGGGELQEHRKMARGMPPVYLRESLIEVDEEGEDKMEEALPNELWGKRRKIVLEPGHYTDLEQVLKAMDPDKDLVLFTYSSVTQKVTVKWRCEEYRLLISLSPALSAKLGFGYQRSSWRRLRGCKITGKQVVTMDFIDMLYINCDLAADSHVVGNALVPLLKTVSAGGSHGDVVSYEPRVLDWLPLSRNRFDTVRVLITDGTGKPVPFERGHSMVRVHVRERLPF